MEPPDEPQDFGRTVELQIDPGDLGERVDRFVAHRVRSLPRTMIQRLIREGRVTIDGGPPGNRYAIARRPAQRLALHDGRAPTRLVIRIPQAQPEEPLTLAGRVLFQDADLLAIDKPSGYPVVARLARAGEDVVRAARRHLGDPKAYVGTPHRLDGGTSGIVVLALNPAAGRALAEAFEQRRVRKAYLGWVASPPEPRSGVIDAPVLAPGDGSLPRIDPSGKPACTRYRTLGPCVMAPTTERAGRAGVPGTSQTLDSVSGAEPLVVGPGGGAWRVLLLPQTGRTHQLRLHLASLGRPLLGDRAHGGPPAARLWLHAFSLSLPHPRTGSRIRLRAGVALTGSADHNCQLLEEFHE